MTHPTNTSPTNTPWSDPAADPFNDIQEGIVALKAESNCLLDIEANEKIALDRTRRLLGIGNYYAEVDKKFKELTERAL